MIIDLLQPHAAEYVGSYLEFYTTLYGAKGGEQFFVLFWNLGLFKLPFAVIAVMALWEVLTTRSGSDGAWVAIQAMGWRFTAMYFVLILFVWPTSKLDLFTLKYDPPPQFNTVTAPAAEVNFVSAVSVQTHGSSGFPAAGQSLDVRMPIMARLAMMIGHGINRATTKILPDVTSMRLLDQGLANLKLKDPGLKNEVVAFYQQCYTPAVNKWATFWRETSKPAALIALETRYGPQDTGWMGSAVLLQTDGLYKPCGNPSQCGSSLQASTPVNGFPVSTARDGEPPPYTTAATWGRPYCNEWWNRLGDTLYQHIDGEAYYERARTIVEANNMEWFSSNPYPHEQVVLRQVINELNVQDFYTDDLSYNTGKIKEDGIGKSVSKAITRGIAWTGVVVSQPYASAETLVLNNMQQIIQSLCLMVLYLFLPFVALFSGFNIKVMGTYCVLILSVIGWQMWWTLVMWVDSNLIMSMYPDGSLAYSEDFGSKRLLIDRIVNGAATLAPLIWTFVLTFAGYQGIQSFAQMSSGMTAKAAAIAKDAAAQGIKTIESAVSTLRKAI